MWIPIVHSAFVPDDRDIRLAVIDAVGHVHELVFPCRRSGIKWMDAKTGRQLEVWPTHWQNW